MTTTHIPVKIVATQDSNLAVKLPFLDVPVTMNYDFFSKRVEAGYFKIAEEDIARKIRQELQN
ncbi:MAG: hypothetical protein AAF960_03090 [Bacteroidota bacterium]